MFLLHQLRLSMLKLCCFQNILLIMSAPEEPGLQMDQLLSSQQQGSNLLT